MPTHQLYRLVIGWFGILWSFVLLLSGNPFDALVMAVLALIVISSVAESNTG